MSNHRQRELHKWCVIFPFFSIFITFEGWYGEGKPIRKKDFLFFLCVCEDIQWLIYIDKLQTRDAPPHLSTQFSSFAYCLQDILAKLDVDPGFSVGGGANPRGPTYDFAKFPKELREIEKILVRRGAHDRGSPLICWRPILNNRISTTHLPFIPNCRLKVHNINFKLALDELVSGLGREISASQKQVHTR